MPSPALVDVRALRTNAIRAIFDTPPRAFDPSAFHDALNTANWTLRRVAGGYTPPVIRVDAFDASTFDIVLLAAIDADVDYDLVAATGIEAAP